MNLFRRARCSLLFALCCSTPLAFAADPPPAKLKYGTWGFDVAGMDTKTKPGDDFFRYANGTWIDQTQIPPDKPAYSLRLAMTDLTEQRLKDMLEAAGAKPTDNPSTLEEKAGAFYRSFVDEARAEQLGAKAIDPELNDLKNGQTRDDFAALMGRTTTDFEFSLFNMVIDADLKDPKKYAFYLTQAGIGLPDRDYYLKPDFAAQKNSLPKLRSDHLEAFELARRRQSRQRHSRFRNQDCRRELDQNAAARSERDLQSDVDRRIEEVRSGIRLGKIPG
jgi:putative endopeptidase